MPTWPARGGRAAIRELIGWLCLSSDNLGGKDRGYAYQELALISMYMSQAVLGFFMILIINFS